MSYSILDSIGNTPLVEIKRLNPNPRVRILAKLEYFNPGGSVKDRTALYMINAGEAEGELVPGKTVVEATSGNTGIGLALICGVKGYKLLLTMSEAVSVERQKILKARGADIHLTPGHMGTDGAIEEVYRMAREYPETYFMTDQYNNPANWQSHYYGTAVEIWEQTKGKVNTFVGTLGTSGTLMGVSRRLKEYDPDIRIVGVEPYLGHKLQGLKNMREAYVPDLFEKKRLDAKVNIEDEEGFEMTRRLAREEGIFVGMSSGAAMAVAAREASRMSEGTVVVLFPDGGERYLSTPVFTVKDNLGLKLFNTAVRAKVPFVPRRQGKVSMYSCGPTVYRRMHLGECRRFLFADLLCRYLEHRGFSVNHVINITDLDDKTIEGSEKEKKGLKEFTEGHMETFKEDLALLGIKPAARYAKVSEHVDDMVTLAEGLVEKGFAYEKLRSLYFNISAFEEYGDFSGVDLEKIRVGATVDLDEYEKDNPRDFTLLKRSKLSELKRGLCVKTQWGNVRPSLHLQCAAISMKYLGENFDIHTSTRELVFPHHENEVAIAKAATGKDLARFWVHCDQVLSGGKKLNETEGGLTLGDLSEMGYSGREIRWWFLSAHYRKPLLFSEERLRETTRVLHRIDTCILALLNITGEAEETPDLDQILVDLKSGFIDAMDDDMNISAVTATLVKVVKALNILIKEERLGAAGAAGALAAFRTVDGVLGVFDFADRYKEPAVMELMRERETARKERDWERADMLRDRLRELGIEVQDGKNGN